MGLATNTTQQTEESPSAGPCLDRDDIQTPKPTNRAIEKAIFRGIA